jgi:hypothetical protein
VTATTVAPARAPAARPAPFARAFRFELVKQLAQWRVRLLILACWIGPAIAVIVVSGQGTLPSDTLFGREMHATGWAGALVVLSFAGSWFFPLLTSVVAGDVFSSEDRLGTWRHLLVAVRSPRRIFAAKALASLTVLALCVPGLAVSGIVGGLVVGSRPLTGLDGHQLGPMDAAGKLLLAWLCALAPILAFAAIGLLASVIFCRSPIGLLLPAFGGLGMPACGLDTLGKTGAAATALNKAEAQKAVVPAAEQATAAAWQTWLASQHTTGNGAVPDYANPEQMNRFTWYQAHRWTVPYPGDPTIYTPSQVPGGALPSAGQE